MYKYACLNPIAQVGLDILTEEYHKVEEIKEAQAVLVRSASMHDMEFPHSQGRRRCEQYSAGTVCGAGDHCI